MDLDLASRAYLITGGTDGLGLALARRLVGEGASVAVCGRDVARLEAARSALGDADVLARRLDVTAPDGIEAFVAEAVGRFGRLDGVVSNAGHASAMPVAASTDPDWRDDYELKVLPAVRLARAAATQLTEGGSIVNVLSVTAKAPDASTTPTSVSRAAGLALTKALSRELGPSGVRVNAILVGLVESGQWERRAAASNTPLETLYATISDHARIPLGRFGRAEEFADLCAFLLSPRASYVSGAGINLDGGLSPVS